MYERSKQQPFLGQSISNSLCVLLSYAYVHMSDSSWKTLVRPEGNFTEPGPANETLQRKDQLVYRDVKDKPTGRGEEMLGSK